MLRANVRALQDGAQRTIDAGADLLAWVIVVRGAIVAAGALIAFGPAIRLILAERRVPRSPE